jgi:hypothetical protein
MAEITIDLVPDPERDRAARRAALALVTAALYDAEETGHKELSSAALHDLVNDVVEVVGEVREESAPALQAMLGTVSRQYSAFTGVAYVLAAEAFAAGQQSPDAQEPDYPELLRATSEALEALPGQ